MAKIDPADLVDPSEAAALLGLGSGNAVSVYRRRYDKPPHPFPEPVIEKGRCLLWLRADVEQWAVDTGRPVCVIKIDET